VAFLIYIAHAVLVGIVLAAVIALDTSIPAKVLIGAALGLVAVLLLGLRELHSALTDINMFVRLLFISRETQRLDRKDKRPAKAILRSDLEQERSDREIEAALAWGAAAGHYVLYAVVLIATTFGAFFIFESVAS
jgi:hypothetical protein